MEKYVTYEELIQFAMFLIAFAGLFLNGQKRSNRHTLPQVGDYFISLTRG